MEQNRSIFTIGALSRDVFSANVVFLTNHPRDRDMKNVYIDK